MTVLTGGCQCGGARYEVAAAPLETFVCHCRECQRQSASAFGISVIVPKAAFRLLGGELATWTRPTDGGRTLDCTFCRVCGSRLFHTNPGRDTISVKGGSLDEPPDLSAAVHIWTLRKLAGVVIPEGAAQLAGEPD